MSSASPECMILGGPNGAGKSTLFQRLKLLGEFINADDIARTLNSGNPEAASLQAGRLVLAKLDNLLESGADFTYETTLSSHQSLNLMARAKARGYIVALVFIALDTPELHINRVAQRVKMGGHHIPEAAIRRRYDVSFENLAAAASHCDVVTIFNNSSPDGPSLLLEIDKGIVVRNATDRSRSFDQRIAASVAVGLGIDAGAVFTAGRG